MRILRCGDSHPGLSWTVVDELGAGEMCGFYVLGPTILGAVGYAVLRTARSWRYKSGAVIDRRWLRVWKIFFVGSLLLSLIGSLLIGPRHRRADTRNRTQILWMRTAPKSEAVQDSLLILLNLPSMTLMAVCIVLAARARPVRVLVLWSFRSGLDGLLPGLRVALASLGRLDGMCDPAMADAFAPNSFDLVSGSEIDAWKRGILRRFRSARLVLVDVTFLTPGVQWELESVRKPGGPPVILIGGSAVLTEPVLIYRSAWDREFFERLARETARLLPRRRRAVSRGLRAWHRWEKRWSPGCEPMNDVPVGTIGRTE